MTAKASIRRATTTLAVVMAFVALTATALVVAAPSAQAVGPHNQYIAVNVGADGRFNIGAAPDPTTGAQTTGSWDLSYRWSNSPWSSFTTIQVDGTNYKYGTEGTAVTAPNDAGASAWQYGDIQATQELSLVANSATGRQDIVRIAYTVKNTGAAAHAVGVRLMIDTEVNYNDKAVFRVPGVGVLTTERDFTGAAIPHGTYVFYDLADGTHVGYVSSGYEGPNPDRMVFAYWSTIYHALSPWDYTVNPTTAINDSSYALYWNATTLAPGQSRTYVSSYGLGAFDADLTPPLALGVPGPSELFVVGGSYSPNPFDVSAPVWNVGGGVASNVTATIHLSGGLELAGGAATQNLGSLAVNEEKQANWSVRALAQTSDTTATYAVTVVGDGIASKTVTRQLRLPKLGTGLAAPVAKAPMGTITTTKPKFRWLKVTGATKYELRVFKGKKVVLKKTGLTKTSWKARKALKKGVSLKWKVRASNASGPGAWSKTLKFKIK